MAANLKSNQITNRDATPKVLVDAMVSGGAVNHSMGYVFTGSSDAAGSTYRMVQVPSEAQLVSVDYINAALGSGCVVDIAAWYPTNFQSGGGAFLAQSLTTTLISSSTFVTQLNGNTATTTWTSGLTTANTQDTLNYWEQPLWVLLGLSADPECNIDLGFTVRVATATAGYIGMRAFYSY